MMGVLDSLRVQLKQTNDQAFRGLVFDQNLMAQEVGRLQKLVGSAGSAKPTRNRVLEALRRFHQSKSLTSLRETRLICHGCMERFQDGYRLVDDVERFPLLLQAVHQYRDRARALRHCYRGLLHTYFVYAPEENQSTEDGKQNWAELRAHLRRWADRLTGEGMVPAWVAALNEHRNVLTDDPCARYGLSMLQGRRSEFEQVQRELAIPDTSWLIRQLVFAQVHAATQLGDADFKSHIGGLIALLVEHKTVLRPGLAMMLERYKACAAVGVNAELRDFTVSHWGNPWLARNAAAWGLVSEQTRAMVADWLKLEFIQRFFSLLADDGGSDTRRLKFWERYRAHIDDMYFALGPAAQGNRSPDFRAMRQKMSGRLLHLLAPGSQENNAFIMCIGEHVVVEFGQRNNACFVHHRDNLPFDLSGQGVAGNREQLKHDRRLERLVHIDRQDGTWEEHFEATLARWLKVRPSDKDTHAPTYKAGPRSSDQLKATSAQQNAASPASAPRRAGPAPWNYPAGPSAEPFSRREFERFCAVRRLRVVDHTDQGGNLRVVTDDRDESVNKQLKAWSFQYKKGRGWWRKEG